MFCEHTGIGVVKNIESNKRLKKFINGSLLIMVPFILLNIYILLTDLIIKIQVNIIL